MDDSALTHTTETPPLSASIAAQQMGVLLKGLQRRERHEAVVRLALDLDFGAKITPIDVCRRLGYELPDRPKVQAVLFRLVTAGHMTAARKGRYWEFTRAIRTVETAPRQRANPDEDEPDLPTSLFETIAEAAGEWVCVLTTNEHVEAQIVTLPDGERRVYLRLETPPE